MEFAAFPFEVFRDGWRWSRFLNDSTCEKTVGVVSGHNLERGSGVLGDYFNVGC